MIAETRKARLIMELRRGGVSDRRVLGALEGVPREAFVPESMADWAYDNRPLPIGHGQTISQPLIVGLMTQALEIEPRDKILEIGTGSGYQTAILAKLCRRVYSIERIEPLYRSAVALFNTLGIRNVTAMLGDGARGWPEQAPFDRIIVTAAAADLPEKLVEQLKVGGVMVIPVGAAADAQNLLRLRRTEDGITREVLSGVRFVPLIEGPTEGG
jgi:protein-L-isoaspartate(D-aspartate) O-methyltransferase